MAFASGALYEASGALKELVLGYGNGFNGIRRTFTYNSRLQPVDMKAKHTNDTVTVLDLTYSFTPQGSSVNDGHVKKVTNNSATGRSQAYTYDEMNRLKTAKSTATSGPDCWGLDYTYDRYANLTNAAISSDRGGSGCSAPTLSLSIDTSTNRITNTGFQYDAAGNLTNDGSATYTWNAEGRMASTAGVTYTYDGDGKRVKKAAGSPSQYDRLYWYGPGGQVLAESELDGDIISEFIYFGRTRIARRDVSTGNVYYYLPDRLGNGRVLTNSSGTVVEESDFYPFGQERVITGSGTANNYKYTQHERDGESELDHTLYRRYSSTTGRWFSPDSIRGIPADPQTWNRYTYAQNNPCNKVDPDGRQACWVMWTGDRWRMICVFPSPDEHPYYMNTAYSPGTYYESLTQEERRALRRKGPDYSAYVDALSDNDAWDQVRGRIYAGTSDELFTPHILDCIAGIESTWRPGVVAPNDRRGLFQFGLSDWNSTETGKEYDYAGHANNPTQVEIQAQVAVELLRIKLAAVLRNRPDLTTDEDRVKRAVSLFGAMPYNPDDSYQDMYGQKVLECADAMKNHNFSGGMDAINGWRAWFEENKPVEE